MSPSAGSSRRRASRPCSRPGGWCWTTRAAGRNRPELVLVGDGPQRRRLQTMMARLGLAEHGALTGPLDRGPACVAELQRAAGVRPADAHPAGRPESRGPRAGRAGGRGLRSAGGHRAIPAARPRRSGTGRPATWSPPRHRTLAERIVAAARRPGPRPGDGGRRGRAYVAQRSAPTRRGRPCGGLWAVTVRVRCRAQAADRSGRGLVAANQTSASIDIAATPG